jgi:hypothetical protein
MLKQNVQRKVSTASALSSFCHHNTYSGWNVDTGASAHMTFHRHWLRNYKPHCIQIKLANGSIILSEGIGTALSYSVVEGQNVQVVEFTNVLYVPTLRNNLLSIFYLTMHQNFALLLLGTLSSSLWMGMFSLRQRSICQIAHFCKEIPFLLKNMLTSHHLQLSHWIYPSSIIDFGTITLLESKSSLETTWWMAFTWIHILIEIQFVNHAKLDRCMLIPFLL